MPKPQHWGFLSVLTALSHSKETAFLSVVDLGWDNFLSLLCISRSVVCISASSWHKQVSFPSPMDRQLLLNPSLNGSYFCLGPGTGEGEQMGVLPLHGWLKVLVLHLRRTWVVVCSFQSRSLSSLLPHSQSPIEHSLEACGKPLVVEYGLPLCFKDPRDFKL